MNYTCLICGYVFEVKLTGVECSLDETCPRCKSTNTDTTENVARNEAINRADDIKEDKRLFKE